MRCLACLLLFCSLARSSLHPSLLTSFTVVVNTSFNHPSLWQYSSTVNAVPLFSRGSLKNSSVPTVFRNLLNGTALNELARRFTRRCETLLENVVNELRVRFPDRLGKAIFSSVYICCS